mmetsp:Transcript_9889/g.10393  ORF Transcript_9889/g.10393 Transcript_9889/m.10393 type:complete len:510 (+) Transcript_9889:100-1629(+)
MSTNSLLPSLPGYKVNTYKPGPRKQLFQTKEGYKFVKDLQPLTIEDLNSSSSISSLGTSSSTKCFPSLSFDSIVLNFTATVSDIQDYSSYKQKIRRCSILYHIEDNTIKIVEHPQTNIPASTLLRRSVILKENGQQLLLDDIQYGEEVIIYGRVYSIVNCSEQTRQYLESIGRTNLPPAKDEEDERSWSKGPTPEWGSFRREKNNLKVFMEAKLGNTVNNSGREGFNEFGNRVLKFLCVWDDTEKLYGDVHEFILIYHLADDTVEIFNKPSNSGKELFPKLLKRAPLVKDYGFLSDNNSNEEQYYHWSDIYIGCDLNIYSRILHVIDADNDTRDFYDLMDCPLGGGERSISSASKLSFTRTIPPHNGFGSEEDSIKSCVGPLCPSNAPTRINVFENRILSFYAHFIPKNSNDDTRRFVISFYLQDNSIKIQEPPVRNSGFVGGLFLSRRRVKKENSDEYYQIDDFDIGKRVKILTHDFIINGANPFTLKWLDHERGTSYSLSDPPKKKK